MHEKLIRYKDKVSEKWSGLEKNLKVKTIIVTFGLIVILGLLMYLTLKPDWIVLKSNSDVTVIGQMEKILKENAIPSKLLDRATSIEVKETDLNKAKIIIESSDIGKKGISFDEVTQKFSIGMTEGDKKEQYKRLKEQEMKELIETFENVNNATVRLAIPDDSVIFNNNKKEASAGITLDVDASFDKNQGEIIANLVAGSVEGVKSENVTIADTDGNILFSGKNDAGFNYSTKEEIERSKRDEIGQKIEETLKPLFDEIKVLSTIKFDWDKRQQKTVTVTPPINDSTVGVPKTQSENVQNVVNGAAGGEEPGVASNDQTPPNYALDANQTGTFDSSDTVTEYIYNEQEEVREILGGTVIPDKSSIAVTVYKYKSYDEAGLLKSKAINKNLTWEQFKTQNGEAKLIDIDEQLLNTIKIGTGIQNVAITGYEKPIFVPKVTKPIEMGQIIVLVILVILIALLAFAIIRKAQPDEIEEIEPEISIEDLIATNQRDDEEIAEKLSNINEVESEFKLKIEDFVEERSETVANLVRNWINSEWE